MFVVDKSKEIAQIAHKYQQAIYGSPDDIDPPTREDLAEVGLRLWKYTYKTNPTNDYDAFMGLMEWASANTLMQASLHIPSEQIATIGACRWADQGFPRFILPHTFAAALMATSVTEDALAELRAPYKAFMIDVPNGMIQLWNNKKNRDANITWILVQQVERIDGVPAWQYIAHTDQSVCIWRHGIESKYLCSIDLPENKWDGCDFISPHDDRDDRVAALLGRLIVGVCLAAQTPGWVKPTSKHRPVRKPDEMHEPDIRTFKIGKSIKLDCRDEIQAYVRGEKKGGGMPSVRTLVRGHWKTQPHGPQSSLRKIIWREPFWRGPEDAPVLVRPVKIQGDV